MFMQKQSQLYPQPNYLPQYTQSTLILSKNSALLLVIPTKVGVIFNLPFKIRDIHHFAHNNLSRIFSI